MSEYQHLNPDDAIAWLDQDDVRWVDIRDSASFQAGHIKGAVALDNESVHAFIANTPKDHRIVVCCYHGNSSRQAAQFLTDQGFEQCFSLDGGFEHWKTQFPQAVETS